MSGAADEVYGCQTSAPRPAPPAQTTCCLPVPLECHVHSPLLHQMHHHRTVTCLYPSLTGTNWPCVQSLYLSCWMGGT